MSRSVKKGPYVEERLPVSYTHLDVYKRQRFQRGVQKVGEEESIRAARLQKEPQSGKHARRLHTLLYLRQRNLVDLLRALSLIHI